MKVKVILLSLALGALPCLLTAQDSSQRPAGERPPGREGGAGGPGRFRLLPPRVQEQLSLTPEQQKQVADLDAEVRPKIEKILTPEQLQQLGQLRPPQREGGRSGPPGGPNEPEGGPGGPGGRGGQRPVNPIVEVLDLNNDGIIEPDEIAKASESLKKLDKNGDGKIASDEYRPQRPGGPGGEGGPGTRPAGNREDSARQRPPSE